MKILVTGAGGQLGSDVMLRLGRLGIEAVGTDASALDITDRAAVNAFFDRERPDGVILCAAYTNVDLAETEREKCRRVNVGGTANIAAACAEYGSKLLYTSTDYVFDGKGEAPFEVDSPKAPCNFYGETKLGGEEAVLALCPRHFIVRISWVFGKNGKNFVKTMLRLAKSRDEIRVVDDQIGSPTYTPDLAALLCDMISGDKFGVYHATNEDYCSWAEFAAAVMELSGSGAKITPIPSSEYPSPAARPANSRLSKRSLDDAGFDRLPPWRDALARFLSDIDIAAL